jgi:predicted DNA-binding protein (MmcQ/YjbR family)
MKGRSVLDNMREICLALPDTKETLIWGQPHFRVGEKIFAGCGDEKGRGVHDWNEVRPLILESYRLIAPKRTLAKLGPPASRRRS